MVKTLLFPVAGIVLGLQLDAWQKQLIPVTPLTGDWQIETITSEGKPTPKDPAKLHWLRIYFPGLVVAVVTDHGLIWGKYQIVQDHGVEITFDAGTPFPPSPEPQAHAVDTSPAYKSSQNTTAAEHEHASNIQINRQIPRVLTGTYRHDGNKLIIESVCDGQRVELVLRPLLRSKM
ncbi:MAG TPA: hypothetical protein PKA06_09745 [Gemmatales bacterium]|nr:hypothetical protein [Gemmatales bacterium]HMP18673.1 hypothetical protein [Gemmatales bacterium]